MTTYIALLRAINVSGQNMIKMAELKRLFEQMGFGGVQTYIQSGNVRFDSPEEAHPLRERIEAAIQATFGLTVTVILRTATELAQVVARCPFPAVDHLYVAYLDQEPTPAGIERLNEFQSQTEEWQVAGREVYIIYHEGAGRSKLTTALLEKRLGVSATARNWRTTQRLLAMAQELP